MTLIVSIIAIAIVALVLFSFIAAIAFRRVVPTNMVHIVQSRQATTSYGTGNPNGNVYYAWPSFLPVFGVTVIELPVSNFDLSLHDYDAYDIDRVPFRVDVVAFFRIDDTNVAAQRVSTIEELNGQLLQIVQGAVRKVLASAKIDNIMLERATFGQQFTAEVEDQLGQWGVYPVKSMELMDIRDGQGSQSISNIMAKKISHIEMESRTEVAINNRSAETAEIEAGQAVEIRRQEAAQAVGERTAQKDQAVGIANEQSRQEVLTQSKVTAEREMAVTQVEQVRQAEIAREQAVVTADQQKQTTVIIAEGQLEATRRAAEGIQVEGAARAEAEKMMQLAPVEAQIRLAEQIGQNPAFQQYLATIQSLESYIVVGSKQAEALQKADVKVIANSGNPAGGVSDVMDLFSSNGGTNLAAMVEAMAQTPMGQAVFERLGIQMTSTTAAPPSAPAEEI
jgi:flotillin